MSLLASALPGLRSSGGFSLIELTFVCAILVTLAGLAAPSFRDFVLNARRTEQANALLRALHVSRSAAAQRGEAVVLCKSRDGQQCSTGASGWNEGWIAFANLDRDSPAEVDPGEPLLFQQAGTSQLRIHANRNALVYWPFSLAATTATFTLCDERGASAARAIVVSQTGRPRTSTRDASGRDLQCPL